MVGDTFIPGEFFVYVDGSSWELGKVKKAADDEGTAYFCWYSSGTTASRTPVDCMHHLKNCDGGPANQYTLDRFVACACCDDTFIEVEDYFSERIIWTGLSRDLPPDLADLPVEDSGVELNGGWARVCL